MKQQLEIPFEAQTQCRPFPARQRRQRAKWWFNRMRQVVDSAFDWKMVPQAPAEQIYFPLENRRR
jgi:hypothetical protein